MLQDRQRIPTRVFIPAIKMWGLERVDTELSDLADSTLWGKLLNLIFFGKSPLVFTLAIGDGGAGGAALFFLPQNIRLFLCSSTQNLPQG